MDFFAEKNYEYFIDYKDDGDYENILLCIMLPTTNAYVKSFMVKLNGCIFLIKDAESLKKYTDIWIKVSNSVKKVLDCKPISIKKSFENHNKVLQ